MQLFIDMGRTLKVCAIPDIGFYELSLRNSINYTLLDVVGEFEGNFTTDCAKLGSDPQTAWDNSESRYFPITGLMAETINPIFESMGSDWTECVISFLPTYTL